MQIIRKQRHRQKSRGDLKKVRILLLDPFKIHIQLQLSDFLVSVKCTITYFNCFQYTDSQSIVVYGPACHHHGFNYSGIGDVIHTLEYRMVCKTFCRDCINIQTKDNNKVKLVSTHCPPKINCYI